MEGGCAVCGQLTPISQLSKLLDMERDLDILTREDMGITHVELFSSRDPIQEMKGPILHNSCTKICRLCKENLV